MISKICKEALLFNDNRKKISFNERRSTYIAINKNEKQVEGYQIDGILIKDGCKCDNGLAVLDDKNLLLIELKGRDLKHACEQISKTLQYLKFNKIQANYSARIVLSKATAPDIQSIQYKKLSRDIKKEGGTLKKQTIRLEEYI